MFISVKPIRVYADGLESSKSGHMSFFTVNFFVAGVHHLDDSNLMAQIRVRVDSDSSPSQGQ